MSAIDDEVPPQTSEPAVVARDGIDIAQRLVTTVALLAVVGTLIALVLVQRIGGHYRDALEVATDGAEVAAVSADAAASLATDLASLTEAANEGLAQTEEIVVLASDAIADVGAAMSTNIADGIEGTANVADGMASFIEGIERFIPGDSQSLAEDLRALADGLEPVPDQLRSLGEQLNEASVQLDGTIATLDELQVQLDALGTSITEARLALVEVEATADELAVRAQAALDDSGVDLWLVRLLVIVIGAGVAAACWAARRALGAMRDADAANGAGGGTRTHTPLGTGS